MFFPLFGSKLGYETFTASVLNLDLKRIINNALDALVNLEEKEEENRKATVGVNELTSEARKMSAHHQTTETATANTVLEKEDLLASEIKELEKILELSESKNVMTTKEDAILNRQLSKHVRKDEQQQIASLRKKDEEQKLSKDTATASQEEKANVVIDNANVRDLVDLIVRAIDDEAGRGEEKNAGRLASENDAKMFKKEAVMATADVRKEKIVVEGKKEIGESETLCNTRKRECVEVKKEMAVETTKAEDHTIAKKATTEEETKLSAHTQKKEAVATNAKAAKTEDGDSMEIRKMVDEILNGKSEEEREAFASLLESVFERTKSSASADTSAITKVKKNN